MPEIDAGTIKATLKVGGTQEFKTAMDEAGRSVDGFASKTQDATRITGKLAGTEISLSQSLDLLKNGFDLARNAITFYTSATDKAYSSVYDFNRMTGTTVYQGGKWNELLGNMGMSLDTLTYSFRQFSNNVSAAVGDPNSGAGQAFRKLNVSLVDQNGNLKTTNQLMLETIAGLEKMPESAEKNNIMFTTLGRNYMDLNKLTQQNIDIMKLWDETVTEMTPRQMQEWKAYRSEMNKLNTEVENLKSSIGVKLVPMLGVLAKFLRESVVPAVDMVLSRFEYMGYVVGAIGRGERVIDYLDYMQKRAAYWENEIAQAAAETGAQTTTPEATMRTVNLGGGITMQIPAEGTSGGTVSSIPSTVPGGTATTSGTRSTGTTGMPTATAPPAPQTLVRTSGGTDVTVTQSAGSTVTVTDEKKSTLGTRFSALLRLIGIDLTQSPITPNPATTEKGGTAMLPLPFSAGNQTAGAGGRGGSLFESLTGQPAGTITPATTAASITGGVPLSPYVPGGDNIRLGIELFRVKYGTYPVQMTKEIAQKLVLAQINGLDPSFSGEEMDTLFGTPAGTHRTCREPSAAATAGGLTYAQGGYYPEAGKLGRESWNVITNAKGEYVGIDYNAVNPLSANYGQGGGWGLPSGTAGKMVQEKVYDLAVLLNRNKGVLSPAVAMKLQSYWDTYNRYASGNMEGVSQEQFTWAGSGAPWEAGLPYRYFESMLARQYQRAFEPEFARLTGGANPYMDVQGNAIIYVMLDGQQVAQAVVNKLALLGVKVPA